MVVEPICCPLCQRPDVVKHGKTDAGKQRYKCRNRDCPRHSFILQYSYRGYLADVKDQIVNMAMNGSGIRDTARVLKISPTTVIEELKKTRVAKLAGVIFAPVEPDKSEEIDENAAVAPAFVFAPRSCCLG